MLLLLLFVSCSLTKLESGREPAKKKTFKDILVNSVKSPHFWAPLAGAGVIHAAGKDKEISEWAYREKPVFGGRENAQRKSDEFNTALEYQMYATTLLTPYLASSESLGQFGLAKTASGAVVYLAFKQTRDVTYHAKTSAGRERPNGADRLSFPSGHSSAASAARTVTARNLSAIDMNNSFRTALGALNTTLAGGTLWARVESKWHYPVDTLVGYSLGHLVSSIIYDSLINLNPNQAFAFMMNKDGASARYGISF